MRWLATLILALAVATSASAQYLDSTRGQLGLGNRAPSGLGRNADRALPLMSPDKRGLHQNPNRFYDRDTRSYVRPPVVPPRPQ
jgi:hypothetical protein